MVRQSTYFCVATAGKIAVEAFVSGAIGAVLGKIASEADDAGNIELKAKKYMIEGFAHGFMVGAIDSVKDILFENFKRLNVFKTATGSKLKINVDGVVYDEAGKRLGQAFYDNGKTWRLVNDVEDTVQLFDQHGNEILKATSEGLPANEIIRTGIETALLCYTDDFGKIMRVGDDLVANTEFFKNGYKYLTDEQGRVIEASFESLRLKPEGRLRFKIADDISTITHGEIKSCIEARVDKSHLIADNFDGDNTLANLVAMPSHVNQGIYKQIEDIWEKALLSGKKVSGKISVEYDSKSYVPKCFKIVYDIGEGLVEEIIKNR